MEKILLGLTALFFAITGLFYYFLSSFNAESRRQIFMNKIAGVKTERTKATPTVEIAFFPTKTSEPTVTVTPTPLAIPEVRFVIPLGEMMIDGRAVQVSAAKQISSEAMPTVTLQKTENAIVPFADFEIELKFPAKILPGSAENKFIFQNKEYQIKVFSQVGTETGYLREKFFAEKTGKELRMLMYRIILCDNNVVTGHCPVTTKNNSGIVVIDRETGWWGGGEQVAVGMGASDEECKTNVVRFFIE